MFGCSLIVVQSATVGKTFALKESSFIDFESVSWKKYQAALLACSCSFFGTGPMQILEIVLPIDQTGILCAKTCLEHPLTHCECWQQKFPLKLARPFSGPTLNYNFCLCKEFDRVPTLPMQGTKEALFPATERKKAIGAATPILTPTFPACTHEKPAYKGTLETIDFPYSRMKECKHIPAPMAQWQRE